jgi:hypothetical protein
VTSVHFIRCCARSAATRPPVACTTLSVGFVKILVCYSLCDGQIKVCCKDNGLARAVEIAS